MHLAVADDAKVNLVRAVVVQDVHREDRVGTQEQQLLGLVAVSVVVNLLQEHAAVAAIGVAPWWLGLSELDSIGLGRSVAGHSNLNGRFFPDHSHVTPEDQRVGDLAPVGAAAADAGLRIVHSRAGVRPLDLGQLLVHALFVVGVQAAEPRTRPVAVITDLGPTEHPTPDRLHAVIRCVLDVVFELTATRACASFCVDVFEQRQAVLRKRFGNRRGTDTGRPLPRQGQGRSRRRLAEVLVDTVGNQHSLDVVHVEPVALGHTAHTGGLPHLLAVFNPGIGRVRYAQYAGGVAGDGVVDGKAELVAQLFEALGQRIPVLLEHQLVQGPVGVDAAARVHHPRIAQRRQPGIFTELVQRHRRSFGARICLGLDDQLSGLFVEHRGKVFGVVAVDVHSQHLTGVHVVLGAVFVGAERTQCEICVESFCCPLLNGGHDLLKRLSKDVFFFI